MRKKKLEGKKKAKEKEREEGEKGKEKKKKKKKKRTRKREEGKDFFGPLPPVPQFLLFHRTRLAFLLIECFPSVYKGRIAFFLFSLKNCI